jgi:hypothetical protein
LPHCDFFEPETFDTLHGVTLSAVLGFAL